MLDKSRQAQQEQERAREIADSLNQLPQQQTDARRQLNEIERRLGTLTGNTPLNQAQNFALQSDSARLKALVDELELAQLSANNRQELARLRSELAEKESQQLDAYLQALRNQLNSQRQLEAGGRWKVPNYWQKTVPICRKISSRNSKLTANYRRH